MSETMKALCYIDNHNFKLQDVEKPKILKPTDVLGKVVRSTICGSDLHIIDGFIAFTTEAARARPGRGIILGHEGVIQVTEIGSEVKNFKVGDVAIVSCITSCGNCYYCNKKIQAHCSNTEGTTACILGVEEDGLQAEFARIPEADHSLYKAPEGLSLDALMMLSDILPTSYELGVENRVEEGDITAIVGMGPVGLAALLSLVAFKPSQIIAIDFDDNRLEFAKKIGATATFNPSKDKDTVNKILKMSAVGGRKPGVDLAIECVGVPASFKTCEDIIGPGGKIANVGVHGKPVELDLQNLWIQNINISTGLVSAYSTIDLMDKVVKGEIDPAPLVTHRFKLSEVEKAYDVFKRANETGAIKVSISPDDE